MTERFQNNTEQYLLLQGLPKVLWELGGSRPEASHLALRALMDAARYASPGSLIAQQLASMQQPALALFYCTETSASQPSVADLPNASGKNPKSPKSTTPSKQPARLSQLAKLPYKCQVSMRILRVAGDLMHLLQEATLS